MSAWLDERALSGRVQLSSALPESPEPGRDAIVVVNAAGDHETTVDWALSAGLATIVEKPMALSGLAAQRLADLARDRGVRFAPAHVFLFARYVEHFAAALCSEGSMQRIEVEWTDPRSEERYEEQKRYDASVPVFADWLPHIVSVLGALVGVLPDQCQRFEYRRGGAALELELTAGEIPCSVRIARNADRRRRFVRAIAGGRPFELDFSSEPGMISGPHGVISGDPEWSTGMRPVARMLSTFLGWAAGGPFDDRLATAPALRACQLIDEVARRYRAAAGTWIAAALAAAPAVDDDLHYALTELVQRHGRLPEAQIEQRITDIINARETRPA